MSKCADIELCQKRTWQKYHRKISSKMTIITVPIPKAVLGYNDGIENFLHTRLLLWVLQKADLHKRFIRVNSWAGISKVDHTLVKVYN